MILTINTWWEALSTTEQIFWGISLGFSILFLLQTIMTIIGLDSDADGEIDLDGTDFDHGFEGDAADVDAVDVDAVDTDHGFTGDHALDGDHGYGIDPSFTLFSIRSTIAFFLFFGWVGVLMLSKGATLLVTIIVAYLAGQLAMVVVAYLLFQMAKMTEVGNIRLKEAIGQVGEVYFTIPAKESGRGKVSIPISGRLVELEAVTKGKAIKTGESVEVLDILEGNVLLVE